MDYWEECIKIAFEEAEITATDEQISFVIGAVKGGHENYGMAHGYDCIPNPLEGQVKELNKRLTEEQNKVNCDACNGKGYITIHGIKSVTSQCWKCRGDGRHL